MDRNKKIATTESLSLEIVQESIVMFVSFIPLYDREERFMENYNWYFTDSLNVRGGIHNFDGFAVEIESIQIIRIVLESQSIVGESFESAKRLWVCEGIVHSISKYTVFPMNSLGQSTFALVPNLVTVFTKNPCISSIPSMFTTFVYIFSLGIERIFIS